MDGFIKIVESLKESGLLIDDVIETVEHQVKKQGGGFLGALMALMAASLIAPMAFSLIQPVASSLANAITGKGVRRAGKWQEGGFHLLLALSLMVKVLGKGVINKTF